MPSYLHFDSIDSTSSYLMARVSSLQDRTFVSASFQTHGKGRLSRVWESKPGENLLFSFLLKDERLLSRYEDVSLLAGYCVAKTFEDFGADEVSIKWPNDVYLSGKKACGILLEGSSLGGDLQAIVAGVGVNLNQTSFPAGIDATSLFLSLGTGVDLERFRSKLYQRVNEELDRLASGDRGFLSSVQRMDFLRGKDICYESSGPRSGHCLGIDGNGHLLVEREGRVEPISYGEANLIRSK